MLGIECTEIGCHFLIELDVEEEDQAVGKYVYKYHGGVPPLVPAQVYLEIFPQDLLSTERFK